MDLLSGLLFSSDGGIDMKVARSVIEMRAAIGPDVARRCAQRRGSALVERLRGRYQQMLEDVDDVESLQTHDIEFWQLLVEGADNIAYRLAYNSLRATYEQQERRGEPTEDSRRARQREPGGTHNASTGSRPSCHVHPPSSSARRARQRPARPRRHPRRPYSG